MRSLGDSDTPMVLAQPLLPMPPSWSKAQRMAILSPLGGLGSPQLHPQLVLCTLQDPRPTSHPGSPGKPLHTALKGEASRPADDPGDSWASARSPEGGTASHGDMWGSPGPVTGWALQGTSTGRSEEAG